MAPLLSGSMETSVRLRSGFVNSSGNRHVSTFCVAIESIPRASEALDEAVACEARRWTSNAQRFSGIEFRFALVDCEKTRALWSRPELRWTMLGMRKTNMVLQQ